MPYFKFDSHLGYPGLSLSFHTQHTQNSSPCNLNSVGKYQSHFFTSSWMDLTKDKNKGDVGLQGFV